MAKAAAQQALVLDNQLAEAHISLASILMLDEWDWENSGKEFRIGLELNPGYATGHHWYAEWLLFHGRATEGLQEIALAAELDPISTAILKDQGMAFYYTRQYDKAYENAIKTLELNPEFITGFRLKSLSLQATRKFDEAMEANEKWGKLTRDQIKTKLSLAHILATAGQQEEALSMTKTIITDSKLGNNDYRTIGQIFAALGNLEEAFKWLELSYIRREEALCNMKLDPKMDPLRDDPRFDLLVKKIGL